MISFRGFFSLFFPLSLIFVQFGVMALKIKLAFINIYYFTLHLFIILCLVRNLLFVSFKMIWFAKDIQILLFFLLWIVSPNSCDKAKNMLLKSTLYRSLKLFAYKLYFRTLISKSQRTALYKIEHFITSVIWFGKVIDKNFPLWTLINFSSLYVQIMSDSAFCHFPSKFVFLSSQKH